MWKSGPHASKQQLSLQQQLTQQRVVIAAMRQQHADELSLLREAHDAEVATLRATVSELRREIKTHRASILYQALGALPSAHTPSRERLRYESDGRRQGLAPPKSYRQGHSYREQRRRTAAALTLQRWWRGYGARHIFRLVGEYASMMAAVKAANAAKREAQRQERIEARRGSQHRDERRLSHEGPAVTRLSARRASATAATAAAAATAATAAASAAAAATAATAAANVAVGAAKKPPPRLHLFDRPPPRPTAAGGAADAPTGRAAPTVPQTDRPRSAEPAVASSARRLSRTPPATHRSTRSDATPPPSQRSAAGGGSGGASARRRSSFAGDATFVADVAAERRREEERRALAQRADATVGYRAARMRERGATILQRRWRARRARVRLRELIACRTQAEAISVAIWREAVTNTRRASILTPSERLTLSSPARARRMSLV